MRDIFIEAFARLRNRAHSGQLDTGLALIRWSVCRGGESGGIRPVA